MPTSPSPLGFDEIQRQELSRLFGRMVWLRLAAFPPVFAALAWFIFTDAAPWRRVVCLVAGTLIFAFFVFEALRFRWRGMGRQGLEFNLSVAAVGLTTIASVTGGLESPFIYPLIVLAFLLGIFSRRSIVWPMLAFYVAAIWSLALVARFELVTSFVPSAFGGGARAGHNDELLFTGAAVLSLVVAAAAALGRVAGRSFDVMIRRALAAQEDSLRTYAEQAQVLTSLSAEIAHELKNPLASVKGLAGLLAQTASDQKSAERVSVLRREVDRMQSVLEEFLNFSRPLVPLALGTVDLGPLCREVAALHEGIAQERGVRIEVRGEHVAARCDPRKMKQVLVNLIQNAIEASSRGGAVELECGCGEGGAAWVRVLDRGHGIDSELGEKIFAPGVTTKARGSGLGLTIARALARQHGGDLLLAGRPGGGCAAEIRLPADPAASPGAAA